jgi:hypothetical protein
MGVAKLVGRRRACPEASLWHSRLHFPVQAVANNDRSAHPDRPMAGLDTAPPGTMAVEHATEARIAANPAGGAAPERRVHWTPNAEAAVAAWVVDVGTSAAIRAVDRAKAEAHMARPWRSINLYLRRRFCGGSAGGAADDGSG